MRKVPAALGITGAVVSLAFALTPAPAAEQRDTHARLFPPSQLGLLEAAGRDEWQEPQRVMDSLGIADGLRIAAAEAVLGSNASVSDTLAGSGPGSGSRFRSTSAGGSLLEDDARVCARGRLFANSITSRT